MNRNSPPGRQIAGILPALACLRGANRNPQQFRCFEFVEDLLRVVGIHGPEQYRAPYTR